MAILAAVALAVGSISPASERSAELPRLNNFPGGFIWHNQPARWNVERGEVFTLSAGPKTDWFAWPGGGDRHDASPRLMFKAADDFMISTRVTTIAKATYDAGCIALYGTATAWAKFCLEALDGGKMGIISVVTRDLSDDVTSFSVEGRSAWLKLAKLDRLFMLYSSTDGKKWTIVRKFNLESPSGFLVGFSAQSPNGEGATAIFDQSRYQPGRIDIWKLDYAKEP